MQENCKFDSVYEKNIDTVYRVCFIYMKNKTDAEDMAQTTFLKYIKANPVFENEKHEQAWFIVTATNTCKNHFKTWWNKNTVLDFKEVSKQDDNTEILDLVLSLPNKYKNVIYMYYYGGYSTKEIAHYTNSNESTIRTHLSKGREILKKKMGSE